MIRFSSAGTNLSEIGEVLTVGGGSDLEEAAEPELAALALPLPLPPPGGAPAAPFRKVIARRSARQLLVLLDLLGVALSFGIGIGLLALGIGDGTTQGTTSTPTHLGVWVLAFVPLYLLSFAAYGLYRRERRRLFATNFPDLIYLAHALAVAGGLSLIASHLLTRFTGVEPTLSLTGACAITAPALVTVPLARVLVGTLLRLGGRVRSRVIILGSGMVADSLARRLASFDDLELLGCVDDSTTFPDSSRWHAGIAQLGPIAELSRICEELDADRVIVAFSPAAAPALADTLRQLPPSVQISVVPRLFDLVTWRSSVDELHGLPVIDVAPPVLGSAHRATKRAVDLTVSLLFVLVTLPFWIMIAVLIKVTSPGPVFFRQTRCGRGAKPFRIYKFRTMRVGAEDERVELEQNNEVDGPLFKMKQDPRVTRVGRILRATSLDELPQLLNVILGDMSLVGPRPFVIAEADRIDGWAARRFDVRPGMTGLWQVSGRNDLPFDELQRLDYAYVASWSLWWDLKIIWQTPGSVFHRRGAY
jgi:exopolysaccharide biosynthesis polyprenyl glycosylphosphotransferase